MAGTFQKTILAVGSYESPDGAVNVTPNRLRHWEREFSRMADNRQVVPMHWDHGTDLKSLVPLDQKDFDFKESRSAKNTVGRMTDFRVLPGGQKAEVTYRTSDPVATQRVEDNDVYVSPVILPRWRDGGSNNYTDVITHLDLVNHAVDHSQGPARRVDDQPIIACALRMGTDLKPLRLATEPPMDFPDKDEEKEDLIDSLDDDGDGGVEADELSDDEFSDDNGETGDDEFSEDNTGDDEFSDDIVDEDLADDQPGIGDIMLALADHGVILPDDTQDTNFLDRLRTALIAKRGASPGQPDGGDKFDEGDTIVADPQIATMSSMAKFANRQHKKDIDQALENLLKTGRCSSAEYKRVKTASKGIRLSLNAQGAPKSTKVSAWIESRASLPAGAVWDGKERLRRMSSGASNLQVADPPTDVQTSKENADMSPDELDKQVKQFLRT